MLHTYFHNTALDLGAKQVCLTTHHSGGFALWPVLQCYRAPPPNPNPNPKLGPMLLCWASSDDLAGRRRPAASPRWVRFSSSDFHAGSCNIDDVIATLITFNSQANESEQLFNRSQPVRRDQT